MFDENFLKETHKLYPWQIEIMQEFAKDKDVNDMIRLTAVAANGSGKSQFILAPCIAWMAVAFEQSLSYVTSSSASQLDTQTERFLDNLAIKMNDRCKKDFGLDVWDNIKRKKTFLPNRSFIDLFATDEPKRAEGKHPIVPEGEFAIFVDEGKSIAEDIYGAIDRCTGATRRLDISSAGGCSGHFYEINTREELGWKRWKIKYTDCPHWKKEEALQLIRKHGINDPLIRSILFSEFTDVNDSTVIRREALSECKKLFNKDRVKLFTPVRAGIDVAFGGGDEMVISVWEGNICIGQETVRLYNAEKGVDTIVNWIQKYKLEHHNVWIEFDGINKGMVYALEAQGYFFNKFLSGGKAKDSKRYTNRMSEQWFKIKRYIEEGWIKPYPDNILESQLVNRYYKRSGDGDRIMLERKEEAKKKGHPSPDRADAMMIAWADCPEIEDFLTDHVVKDVNRHSNKYGKSFDSVGIFEFEDKLQRGESFFEKSDSNVDVPVNGSSQLLEEQFKDLDEVSSLLDLDLL